MDMGGGIFSFGAEQLSRTAKIITALFISEDNLRAGKIQECSSPQSGLVFLRNIKNSGISPSFRGYTTGKLFEEKALLQADFD
jgi:hypothetical protein